jgi:acyl transferase domain-containing protein/acyl carrier protein
MTSSQQSPGQQFPGQPPGRLQPVAIVGVGAIMPQAPTAAAFWSNITGGRYSITDVPKDRWDPDLYYDPDPRVPDKTYSRIGGWVREFAWDPIKWRLPVPPKVGEQMDDGQKWAVSAAREALVDAGWPEWKVDPQRVAVILGNALGGEKHYASNMRIQLPEFTRELERSAAFSALPAQTRQEILEQTVRSYLGQFPEITEDSMPGELANIIAGRIANLFNFRGPSYTTDAACASALAGISAATRGLVDGHYDAVVTGGVDRNMGPAAFVKFCKIGALSATGTRPFDAGADGFVMGEGAALFVLRRLSDAERDGDKIYAVLLGIAGSSDGKGKGITAPNPVGQKLVVERAWRIACADPSTASCIEAHGTSTRAGDASELQSMTAVLGGSGIPPGSVALGSVKSNIGHLKGAAGAAGLFKMTMSLHDKVLPPSLNFRDPNPNVDWAVSPFRVNTELREWPNPAGGVRRGGVSAFGFGGTNFHAVLEEYIPGRYDAREQRTFAGTGIPAKVTAGTEPATAVATHSPAAATGGPATASPATASPATAPAKAPLRGALVVGGDSDADVAAQLGRISDQAKDGWAPGPAAPDPAIAGAAARAAIDYGSPAELADKADKAARALATGNPQAQKILRARGVFIGHGPAPKVAFLYTGQGSQYVNMLSELRETEPIVARTFAEADEITTPLLGQPLSSYIFIDQDDPAAVARLEQQLLQTEITQPAVMASDLALTRLLAAYGVRPDMVMGHSVGEYGALMAAGSLSFEATLEAVSARGREMANLDIPDPGAMAAVMAPLDEIEHTLAAVDGYVVMANINSGHQAVIGGATAAVEEAVARFAEAGRTAIRIPVSMAFHTSIVAPVSEPLRRQLARLGLRPPAMPIVANVNGEFYPVNAPDVIDQMLDMLGRQVASPVQFVKGLRALYDAGARVFVEVGPKKALQGFAEDVLGADADVFALFTNHPKFGDVPSFNAALCGLYAAGLGYPAAAPGSPARQSPAPAQEPVRLAGTAPPSQAPAQPPVRAEAAAASTSGYPTATGPGRAMSNDPYAEFGRLVVELLDRGRQIFAGTAQPAERPVPQGTTFHGAAPGLEEAVVITGAALGLPGTERVFDDENVARILAGEQFIDVIPRHIRHGMADKHIIRLLKSDQGDPVFEPIEREADVIKLAGRYGSFDPVEEFGVDADRNAALDQSTRLAIGAGLDAMRDAGIPLVQHYRATTLGTKLPDRWGLPDALRDDTAVIFASAFPGYESFADELNRYHEDRARRHELATLEDVRSRMSAADTAISEVDRRIAELRHMLETQPFTFDRRFLFRALPMGHAQFAEIIGARGPNTQLNAACASTAQGLTLAEDWIRRGRCRRAVVISADDVASDTLLPWIGSGFLASGAAATDDVVEDAALPFDRRRHGMIIGSGAAALVVESAEAARERGIRPICEVLASVAANSAFHGTRLDVDHIGQVMEELMSQAERRGVDRHAMAGQTMFMSHETYTPARGGSASAEINALRRVFGPDADSIVIANTKGFTGHAMGAGIEEVVAVKALETGIVPPVPNFREVDPELGQLNLSKGGAYPVTYALRLAAGFGSQISMALLRWSEPPNGQRHAPSELGFAYRIADEPAWRAWLARISGSGDARLEVVQRRLRIADGLPQAHAARPAALDTKQEVPAGTAHPAPAPAAAAPAPATPATRVTPAAPTAPAGPAAPAEPAAAGPAAAGETDPVAAAVVDIVENLTGYPRDLLDLDLDLEADLGVDTVKQAEVFAGVRERFGIPRDEDLKLRDFPTLAHVIAFVRERANLPAPTAQPRAAAAEPVAESAGAGDTGLDFISAEIVQIVSDMTGYPPDLLDLDLDLEADLGIDTVKQAEVFAGVRERFGIPRDEDLKLRDFPTLAHVIAFARERGQVAGPASAPGAPAAASAAPAESPDGDPVTARIVQIVSDATGYPPDLLDLDLDLEADLGIDTVKQAEVFAAVRAGFGIPREQDLKLRDFPTLAHVIAFARERSTGGAAAGPPQARQAPGAQPAALAAAATPESVPAPAGGDAVTARIVQIVSDATGYPPDLLDLDLDLEADLGIDTVKQAEVFAAVRAGFGIPRDEDLKLRDFPTLAHVIAFARERSTGSAAAAPPTAGEPATSAGGIGEAAAVPNAAPRAAPAFVGDIAAAEQIPRRIPAPVLRPPARWCKPTGVTLDKTRRVVVMTDEGGVGKALVRRLGALGVATLVLQPGCAREDLEQQLTEWLAHGPVHGLYWLPALDAEPPMRELDLAGWKEALRRRVKSLYAAVRHLDANGQLGPRGTFLVSATRLGGYHGYDEAGAQAPLGGAVTGFTKAYARERPDLLAKAVDFYATKKTAALADALIEETLTDPGAVEIGRAGGRRWAVGLREVPFGDGSDGMALSKDTVFAVTGAAGAIVSAIVADLAKSSGGGVFHLLDLTPEPDPGDEDLARYTTDRDGLKAAITERIAARGERPTPVLIERELSSYERLTSALIAIESVREAGGEAYYHPVDLTDPDAVAAVIGDIRERHGHIDVLLHAAGLEISHTIAGKEEREFNLVFDVKSDGLFNLLHAAGELPIGATVVFSSVAGRFGNNGQTDYSAANDLLCKIMSSFRNTRPGTRGIALDWTAWGGIGMATRGSIPKVMEMAGIDMLPPEAGIAWIGRELTAGPSDGEIVVAGKLGIMIAELDPTGGLDATAIDTNGSGPMAGQITGMGVDSGLTAETTLDPAVQPFLNDHRIDGTPVLPGVMGVEAFAALAQLAAPDLHVAGVEEMEYHSPVKFYRDEPRALTLRAIIRPAADGVVADCSLSASRSLKGDEAPRWTTHFTGSVRLTAEPPARERDEAPAKRPGRYVKHDDIYHVYFHGPAYQVLDEGWQYDGGAVGRFAAGLPPGHVPQADPTVTEPRLAELCFQTAGLWEIGTTGQMPLPAHIDRVVTVGTPQPGVALFAIAHPASNGGFDCRVVDASGDVLVRMDGYRTVQVGPLAGDVLGPIRTAMSVQRPGDATTRNP